MTFPKLLFICKRRIDSYGNSFGLVNSATFVSNFLATYGVDTKVIMAEDGNSVDREVTNYNPTHVFIEAMWVTASKFAELLSLRRHKKRKWVVRIHSKIPFIANEGIAFPWLNEYKGIMGRYENLSVAPNSQEFHDDLVSVLGLRSVFLPNIYFPPRYDLPEVKRETEIIDIGCFGAIRPMKNQLIQAVAAIKFADHIGKKVRFHINGNRQEQHGDQVLKNIQALFAGAVAAGHNVELVEHPWEGHKEFIATVRTMDLGMQVSMSESFNIVTADFVSNDVPTVVSPDVDWMPALYRANPNSSAAIARKLDFAWTMRPWHLHNLCRWALLRSIRSAGSIWLDYLEK